MREGWKCPACSRINSPDLDWCPCSGGSAGVTAPATPIYPGTSGGTTTIMQPLTSTTWQGGGGGGGAPGVTVTYHVTGSVVTEQELARQIRKSAMARDLRNTGRAA